MQGGGRQPHIMQGIDKSYNNTKQIEIANCLTARKDRGISNRKYEGTAVLECVGNINPSGKGMNGNVFDENGLAPTITTNKGEGNKIAVRNDSKLSHAEWKERMYEKFIEDADGEVSGVYTNQSQNFGYRPPMKGLSKTLRANANDTGIVDGIKIRKLTPKECFRLMGFSDENFEAAEKMVSNSQLYKQAGNSIVVDVLYYILVELYKAMPYLFDDLKLSSFFSGIGAFEIALNRLYESINIGNFHQPQVD